MLKLIKPVRIKTNTPFITLSGSSFRLNSAAKKSLGFRPGNDHVEILHNTDSNRYYVSKCSSERVNAYRFGKSGCFSNMDLAKRIRDTYDAADNGDVRIQVSAIEVKYNNRLFYMLKQ